MSKADKALQDAVTVAAAHVAGKRAAARCKGLGIDRASPEGMAILADEARKLVEWARENRTEGPND